MNVSADFFFSAVKKTTYCFVWMRISLISLSNIVYRESEIREAKTEKYPSISCLLLRHSSILFFCSALSTPLYLPPFVFFFSSIVCLSILFMHVVVVVVVVVVIVIGTRKAKVRHDIWGETLDAKVASIESVILYGIILHWPWCSFFNSSRKL